MKSYTDISQSKKLAEILPLESADMGWYYSHNPQDARNQMWAGTKSGNADIPCWSLAALLNVLPEPELIQNSDERWMLRIWDKNRFPWSIGGSVNPVDACYELILKLHEQNLL